MKKIINGIRYNTESATEIGHYATPGLGGDDFHYWGASLYKSPRSGRFFLAGEGHAMTRFASTCGNMKGWGARLIPMTEEEALEWAEQYLDPSEFEEHFADMIEDA